MHKVENLRQMTEGLVRKLSSAAFPTAPTMMKTKKKQKNNKHPSASTVRLQLQLCTM